MRRLVLRSALLAVPLLLAACGGTRPPVGEPEPLPEPEPAPYATYETFDPSRYDAEPPPVQPEPLRHDVPELLMEGRLVVDDGAGTRVQGFRIQVASSPLKADADAVRDSVRAWWGTARTMPDVPPALAADPSVDVDFQRPYYRVRLGGFLEQEDALDAVGYVRRHFPEAFVVPAEIVVR